MLPHGDHAQGHKPDLFYYNSIVTRGKFFFSTFGNVDFRGKPPLPPPCCTVPLGLSMAGLHPPPCGSVCIHQVFCRYAPVGFLHGAEFGAVGDMGCIRLKNENSWCTNRGCGVQNLGPWVTWIASDCLQTR